MKKLWLLALVFIAPAGAAEPQAFRCARLWPGDGPAIVDAVLVVRDGKIVAAGRRADVAIPAGTVVHDLGDATIIPGLIAAETSLADKGRDDLHALTPHHRAVDGFDWYADFHGPLSGGVTTVQLAPGSKRLLPGQGSVVKLFGDDPEKRTLREVEGLRVLLGDAFKNPPRVYEPPVGAVSVDRPLEATKQQLAGSLASAVAGLRASFQAARSAKADGDPYLRAVAAAGNAKQPVRVTAPGATDVQAALELAKEFDLHLILVEPPVAKDKLAAWKPHVDGVVLSAGVRPGQVYDDAAAHVPADAARDLRGAGFRVALKPAHDNDLKDMLYLAGLLTQRLSPEDALRAVTADAAALLGVADRVGTLAAGRDADFVVLSGEPFALHSRVKAVYVDGEKAYEAKAGHTKVIHAARILTGTGDAVAGGSVLIEGKTIRAVGRDVATPPDAEEKRFANAVIVPGFLDLDSHLGVGGPVAVVPPGTKLGDRLITGDPAAASARQGGVTTVLLAGPAPGPVLAFKLTDKPRVVKEPVALRFALRGNLTQAGSNLRDTLRSGKAYADSWTKYEAELPVYEAKKKEFDEAQAKAAAEKKDDKKPADKKPEAPKAPEKPQLMESLEAYRALFAGKIPALVEAKREDAIRLAVTICRDEFNVRTALVGADDAFRVVDLLAVKGVTVVAGPELVRTVEREEVNLPLALAVRGVPVAYHTGATSGARNLPLAVGYAVRRGLGRDDGLRGLTATPAQLLGLENVGTLAAGRDADLVVLSGMPFELSTRVLAVMIDGRWVYQTGE
ncbi:MAG: amidohydrolase family protein [Gemmataceae bacterium]